ncbi:MAG: hypothetical protein HYX76_04695 [Acidobacteria bacterium]|nr:hypothetical protein [Acidobacteriota bacterium]
MRRGDAAAPRAGATVIAGISGFKRNAAAAVARDGRLVAVCEEGRVTRVRDIGIDANGFPRAALEMTLNAADATPGDITETVAAERDIDFPNLSYLDHHYAHAATAFLTSPFQRATILVCDTQGPAELTVWRGEGTRIEKTDFEWRGPGFARVYSRLTESLGFKAGSDEYRVEALARVGDPRNGPGAELIRFCGNRLEFASTFDEFLTGASRGGIMRIASAAATVQRTVGELLIEVLKGARRGADETPLCVGGGVFFNTYLNTVARQAGVFPSTFIPVNPGNAGVSAGCALARDVRASGRIASAATSPFLGPEYTNEQIKTVLDNCKLSYDFMDDAAIVRRTVEALTRGELVGWFRGRLEWGTRALGNRSIFANPFAPYVLENLNRFLKHRESHRAYGLVVRQQDADTYVEGPAASPYMECDYTLRNPELFSQVCPADIHRLRVQTIENDPPMLGELLVAFGQATGTPILVNTSFNGLHEPIVCSPRDAVRVFYGTGLDLLVVGNFILRK